MFSTLLILLVFVCIALMVVILLQSGKGGGLAAGFGGSGTGMEMMGSRQTASFLHNATRWLGGAFLGICFLISLMTVRSTGPRSLIETEMQRQAQDAVPAEGQPAEGAPTDLQDILGGEAAPEAPPAGEAAPEAEPGAEQP
ncbi:MAG TPA: preprotein translocase subunit SecG [Gemmatimonadota bacterium]|nr:preprotein translocase subunit SecG [Gemmatimonadota bacterium]